MKVAVCTLCINDWYADIVRYGVKTIENYAKRHGYDFFICNEVYEADTSNAPKRDYPWYKIKAIQKILPKYDFVFWIDADGFILKPELDINHFINSYLKGKDILCAKDWNNTLNTGLMVIRNTPFVHALLYEVWNNTEEYARDFHEQASMGQIYDANRLNSRSKIEIIPFEQQHILYCFWPNYYPDRQFFIHIARCAFNPVGFVHTLDNYCPMPMDEDKPGEYEDRLRWMSDLERCRKDTEEWTCHKGIPRASTRSILYREKYKKAKANPEEGQA